MPRLFRAGDRRQRTKTLRGVFHGSQKGSAAPSECVKAAQTSRGDGGIGPREAGMAGLAEGRVRLEKPRCLAVGCAHRQALSCIRGQTKKEDSLRAGKTLPERIACAMLHSHTRRIGRRNAVAFPEVEIDPCRQARLSRRSPIRVHWSSPAV